MTVGLIASIALSLAGAVAASPVPCPDTRMPTAPWAGTPLHEAIRRNNASAARGLMTAANINELDSSETPRSSPR